jgi:mevalonate kinase
VDLQANWTLERTILDVTLPMKQQMLDSNVHSTLVKLVNLPTHPQQAAVVAFLYLYTQAVACTGQKRGVTFCARSALPVGAGLGSSACYSVCVAAGLRFLFGLEVPPAGDGLKSTTAASTVLSRINAWAFLAEKVIHGNPSGVDNTVSCYGGAISFTAGQIVPLDKFCSLKFLITNTKVPRDTKALVAAVRQRYQRWPSVVEPMLDAIHEISQSFSRLMNELGQQPGADATHSLAQKFEELMEMNHQLLVALGVGHPALERVRQITQQYQWTTKLTGAGGGGCALTLVPPGKVYAVQ